MSRTEIHSLHFDCPADAAQYARNAPVLAGFASMSRDQPSGSDWDLNMGLDQTLNNVANGYVWTEGLNAIVDGMEITDQLAARSELPAVHRHVVGTRPCVAAHVMGHPRDMFRKTPSPTVDRPVLSIGLSMGMVWSTKAEQRLNLGAAMLSAVDQLERSGYRCELTAVWRAAADNSDRNLNNWANIEIQMKAAGERWNPASMAFMIAHPAAQRRLNFRLLETQQQWQSCVNGAYCDNTNTNIFHRSMSGDFDIYFENMMRDTARKCNTPAKAFAYVEQTINDHMREAKEVAS